MARDTLAPQSIGSRGSAKEDITFTAFVAANDMQFANTGRELLLVKNDGTSGAQSVAVLTPTDPWGRTRPATTTIDTGQDDVSIAGPFDPAVFNQSDGNIYIDGATEDSLSLAVVKFDPKF